MTGRIVEGEGSSKGKAEVNGVGAAVRVAEWWAWHWGYLTIVILATLGSVAFCAIPGWGIVAGVVCSIIATVTGFKAGMQHHKETIE